MDSITDFLRRRAAAADSSSRAGIDPSFSATTRRIITREEAVAFAKAALHLRSEKLRPWESISIRHSVLRIVRITNNTHVVSAEMDRFHLKFYASIGSGIALDVDTSVRDLPTLQTVFRNIEERATPPLRSEDITEDMDAPWHVSEGPHTYLPVALWHPATYDALVAPSQHVTGPLVERMRTSGFRCAGTIAMIARAHLYFHPLGKLAWGEDTDSEVTATVHALDGKASGWNGQAARNWSLIPPERVVEEAIDMARRNQNRVRVEPGRYTAILGPAAVGALFAESCQQFNFDSAMPWKYQVPVHGKKTKIGERVADARLTMWSDPTDPNYGDYPFFDDLESGLPSGKATWVDKGVLTALAYDPGRAMQEGKTPIKTPPSLQISGGNTTIAEMIANCERGIYVHRIGGTQIVDWDSGMILGNTRNGCFFVKNGKIVSPVIDFRIYESPFQMINQILALGKPERIAFGFGRTRYQSLGNSAEVWPTPPIVVPPMMVQDFNFSALCDAI